MPNHASITLIGHLGRDPEVRQAGENQVCSASIAITDKVKGEEVTSWYDLNIWNKQAETFAKYLHKGDAVMVQGKPRIETYTGKDGTQKTKVSVRVSEFTMLGKRGDGQQAASATASAPAASTYKASADDAGNEPPF